MLFYTDWHCPGYLPLPSILVASSSSFCIRSSRFLGRGAVVPKLLKVSRQRIQGCVGVPAGHSTLS